VSVRTEVPTDVVRYYELTHGPTYLVFKYQLRAPFLPWGETTDYTEAILIVKPVWNLFFDFFFFSIEIFFPWGKYVFSTSTYRLSSRVMKITKNSFLILYCLHLPATQLAGTPVRDTYFKDRTFRFCRKKSSLKMHILRELCFWQTLLVFKRAN